MNEQPQVSEADIIKALEETEKSRAWISKNYDQLRNKFQGKVFAVKNERVVATSESVTKLVEEVKRKGEDPALMLMGSIPPKGVVFIL
jgi:SepF-like predicted cell division protein (DUF552 family)